MPRKAKSKGKITSEILAIAANMRGSQPIPRSAGHTGVADDPKPRRTRTPTPPTPPPAPEPPNPVVLALQEHILGLVNQRTSLQDALVNANAQLRNMQAAAESARERLQTVEGEVQYRFGLIAQLQGKPAQLNVGLDSRAFASIETTMPFSSATQAGVGSIPPRRAPMAGVVGEVRSEDAEDVRRSI